jgi:hypothetical protein
LPIGRRRARRTPHPPTRVVGKRVVVRSFASAASPCARDDYAAHLSFEEAWRMTAYLISLALAGLVAIVLAEGLS